MMGDKGKGNGLYERQGKAVNNFPATMPYPTGDLAAEIISDPLNMSFLKLKTKYDEHTLKQALIRHVNDLLMSLGTGFAYIRNEYLLSVAGKEQFSDLLFYNTKLHAYVVVEVKVTEFESSYLGQLSGYMSLVNHILKDEIDRPTIGLLICRSKNNVFAQYCLEGYNQPIAITAYEGIQILPENFNDTLPSIEELEAEIENNENCHLRRAPELSILSSLSWSHSEDSRNIRMLQGCGQREGCKRTLKSCKVRIRQGTTSL